MMRFRSAVGRKKNEAPSLLLALCLVLISSVPACVSDPDMAGSFKNVFDHYRDQEGIVAISFPPGLVGLFLNDSDPDQAELKKLMQELTSFRMLYAGQDSHSEELLDELQTTIHNFSAHNEFQELFRLQTSTEDILVQILEKDGIVSEAIIMFNSADSFYVADLKGNISIELFTSLAEGGSLQALTELRGMGAAL